MGRIEEIVLIVFVGMILFSPSKMVDMAKSLGGALHEFKKAINPDAPNTQPAPASATAQPVYVQAAKAPARRRRAPTAKKKAKASR